MASPSPVTFATVLASKIKKDIKKIPFQRNEALQRLVKHYIMISFHLFPQTLSARFFDFVGHTFCSKKLLAQDLLSHIHVSMISSYIVFIVAVSFLLIRFTII